jgi:hypothetical protein
MVDHRRSARSRPGAPRRSGSQGRPTDREPGLGDISARRAADAHLDEQLDAGLDDTFPASDPVAINSRSD